MPHRAERGGRGARCCAAQTVQRTEALSPFIWPGPHMQRALLRMAGLIRIGSAFSSSCSLHEVQAASCPSPPGQ